MESRLGDCDWKLEKKDYDKTWWLNWIKNILKIQKIIIDKIMKTEVKQQMKECKKE